MPENLNERIAKIEVETKNNTGELMQTKLALTQINTAILSISETLAKLTQLVESRSSLEPRLRSLEYRVWLGFGVAFGLAFVFKTFL